MNSFHKRQLYCTTDTHKKKKEKKTTTNVTTRTIGSICHVK